MDKHLDEQMSALYLRMYGPLCSYAMASLNSPSLAEEAVQETFMIACRRDAELFASPNPEGWLVLTLKNVIRNQLRAKARLSRCIMRCEENRALIFGDGPAVCDDLTEVEYSDIVSPSDIAMLRMYVFDKCSMLDISRTFNISLEATKKRIQRTRGRLKLNEEKIRKI